MHPMNDSAQLCASTGDALGTSARSVFCLQLAEDFKTCECRCIFIRESGREWCEPQRREYLYLSEPDPLLFGAAVFLYLHPSARGGGMFLGLCHACDAAYYSQRLPIYQLLLSCTPGILPELFIAQPAPGLPHIGKHTLLHQTFKTSFC